MALSSNMAIVSTASFVCNLAKSSSFEDFVITWATYKDGIGTLYCIILPTSSKILIDLNFEAKKLTLNNIGIFNTL